jgi:hypothetical protein
MSVVQTVRMHAVFPGVPIVERREWEFHVMFANFLNSQWLNTLIGLDSKYDRRV